MENLLIKLNKRSYFQKYLKLNQLKRKLLINNNFNNLNYNNNKNPKDLIKWVLKFMVWLQNLKQKMKSYLLPKLKKSLLIIKILPLNNNNNNNNH